MQLGFPGQLFFPETRRQRGFATRPLAQVGLRFATEYSWKLPCARELVSIFSLQCGRSSRLRCKSEYARVFLHLETLAGTFKFNEISRLDVDDKTRPMLIAGRKIRSF